MMPETMAALYDRLERHEGESLFPYKDTTGHLTIGIGRNLDGRGISHEEAKYLLANDVNRVSHELDVDLPWWRGLDQVRQSVLAEMAFNLGTAELLTFKEFLGFVRGGLYNEAAEDMLNTLWARQVGKGPGQRAYNLSEMVRTGIAI